MLNFLVAIGYQICLALMVLRWHVRAPLLNHFPEVEFISLGHFSDMTFKHFENVECGVEESKSQIKIRKKPSIT